MYTNFNEKKHIRNLYSLKYECYEEPRFQRIENSLSIFLILDSENDYPVSNPQKNES